jgi:hypothetical protein
VAGKPLLKKVCSQNKTDKPPKAQMNDFGKSKQKKKPGRLIKQFIYFYKFKDFSSQKKKWQGHKTLI